MGRVQQVHRVTEPLSLQFVLEARTVAAIEGAVDLRVLQQPPDFVGLEHRPQLRRHAEVAESSMYGHILFDPAFEASLGIVVVIFGVRKFKRDRRAELGARDRQDSEIPGAAHGGSHIRVEHGHHDQGGIRAHPHSARAELEVFLVRGKVATQRGARDRTK